MPIKLLVTRTKDASTPDEYVFDQEAITIGRDASSHLTLPDLKRVVSKQHAELRTDKGIFQIIDLGSKNFTYLNDERLKSSRPYELKYGDVIRIGDFEIRLELDLASQPDLDGTVFDVNFVNPFADDVARLTEALRSIREAYEREAPSRRQDALREALQDKFAAEITGVADLTEVNEAHMAYVMIGRLLTPPDMPGKSISPSPYEAPADAKAPRHRDRPSVPAQPQTPSASPIGSPSASRLEALVDVLIGAAARLVNIPWQFRHEFIGQTIMQSEESTTVYSGDTDALREYLLDSGIPEEEAKRRRTLLSDAADDVVRHQMAMMDGYKAGAEQGTKRLLDEFDPAAVEAAVRQEGGLSRYVAPLAKILSFDRLKQKLQELRGQDWSVAERRIFRPAFIKAYLARMTSLRK